MPIPTNPAHSPDARISAAFLAQSVTARATTRVQATARIPPSGKGVVVSYRQPDAVPA